MAMEQMSRSSKQLGAIIRRQRRLQGKTQEQLSENANLRQATIVSVESGEPGTKLNTIFDILAALNLEIVVRIRAQGSVKDIEENF